MTISTIINRDLAFETFQYLPEEDVVNCAKVNKQWKKMVEKNETKLFSKDFLALKGAKDTFVRTRYLLKAINREIEALEDFFADPENQVGLLKIGLSSFSLANEKCASYRDQMQLRIEKNELLGKLKAEVYRLSCINRVELLTFKNFNNNPDMMAQFGGREEYNKLPVIDICRIQPGDNTNIDYISPQDMEMIDPKASIMRGFDVNGREFFTIKFNVVKDGKNVGGPYCTTIFQRQTINPGSWVQGSKSKSLPLSGIICTNSNEAYEGLAKLISTGRLIHSKTREVFFLA